MSLSGLSDIEAAEGMAKAVAEQDADKIRYFCQRGATPDARDGAGLTLLHNAANEGRFLSAAALLEAGADVDASGPHHWTALHYAAYRGNADMTTLLLNAGGDVNAATPDGETPLHTAAFTGHFETVIALVRGGADTTAKNSRGQTAADIATLRAAEQLPFPENPHNDIAIYLQRETKAAELRADMKAALAETLAQDISKLKSLHPERFRVRPRP